MEASLLFEDTRPSVLDVLAESRTRPPREIVDDLWSAGFTIVRRRLGDPFDVPANLVPSDMSYQWNMTVQEPWKAVPTSRHEGLFVPISYQGDIEVGGLTLCERAKVYAVSEHQKRVDGAQKNVDNWIERTGGQFSGGVRIRSDAEIPPPALEFRSVGDPVLARKVIDRQIAEMAPVAPKNASGNIPISAPSQRVPRSAALRWLFNLISRET